MMTDVLVGNTSGKPKMNRKNSIIATRETISIGYHFYNNVPMFDFVMSLARKGDDLKPFEPVRFSVPYSETSELNRSLTEAEKRDEITADSFFQILGKKLHDIQNGDDSIPVVADTGESMFGAVDLPAKTFITDSYYLSVGFSVPAAIGVSVATKGRSCVIAGDGAFQMTGMDLMTAGKYGLKPTVFVFNNDGCTIERAILDPDFNIGGQKQNYNDIHRWKYCEVVDVLGYGKSAVVTTKGECEKVMQEAFEND